MAGAALQVHSSLVSKGSTAHVGVSCGEVEQTCAGSKFGEGSEKATLSFVSVDPWPSFPSRRTCADSLR